MNEAAKSIIGTEIGSGADTTDFEYGTKIGRKAAASAVTEFLFDNPEQVAARPRIEGPADS